MNRADITPALVSRLLAAQLPLRIPEPVATGAPGCGFPRPWSIYR
jgi:hypothetical protein